MNKPYGRTANGHRKVICGGAFAAGPMAWRPSSATTATGTVHVEGFCRLARPDLCGYQMSRRILPRPNPNLQAIDATPARRRDGVD